MGACMGGGIAPDPETGIASGLAGGLEAVEEGFALKPSTLNPINPQPATLNPKIEAFEVSRSYGLPGLAPSAFKVWGCGEWEWVRNIAYVQVQPYLGLSGFRV